jgi:hypothetical protein
MIASDNLDEVVKEAKEVLKMTDYVHLIVNASRCPIE